MSNSQVLKLAGLVGLSLALAGCFSPSRDHGSRGVKLSEAMNSSAQGDTRDLGGSQPHESHYRDEPAERGHVADAEGFAAVSYNETEYLWQVPMDIEYSQPFSGDIARLTHFTLSPTALEDDDNYLGLYLGGATVDAESGSLLDQGTEDLWMFEMGFTYRRYFNSSRMGLSPYVTASLGYALLIWDYRSPVYAGGDIIKRDSLSAVEGSVGIGVATRRDSHLSFFGEVGLGGMGFGETTTEGFENDVFRRFGFFTAKAGLSLKF